MMDKLSPVLRTNNGYPSFNDRILINPTTTISATIGCCGTCFVGLNIASIGGLLIISMDLFPFFHRERREG